MDMTTTLETPDVRERLQVEFDAVVAIFRPYVDNAARVSLAVAASLQPYVDAMNAIGRVLAPVVEAERENSAAHRDYHRRSLARQRRR